MKQLKHKFNVINTNHFVDIDNECIYCGKSGQILYIISMKNSGGNSFTEIKHSNNRSIDADAAIYDKYCPCLTEEEYIIKTIIE